jgi:hypothetical protein
VTIIDHMISHDMATGRQDPARVSQWRAIMVKQKEKHGKVLTAR